jgi:hypothetical protein
MDHVQLLTQMKTELITFYALAHKVGYSYVQFGIILQYKFLCAVNFQRHQGTALPTKNLCRNKNGGGGEIKYLNNKLCIFIKRPYLKITFNWPLLIEHNKLSSIFNTIPYFPTHKFCSVNCSC